MQIEIKNLYKSFGDLKIYQGLDLSINEGEICVIMGRSGQGKSVLLKHLTGLIQPDSGEILIDGENIVGRRERDLYETRRRFGMIFQNGGMLQSLNVAQNVALPLVEVNGESMNKVAGVVAEKLAMVDMKGREHQAVATLSGGQKKRIAIARALVQGADCFLFDEPTAGLDPPISKTVDEVIMQVNKDTGSTMIVVTHDLVSAFTIADRVHLLHDGRIVDSGTPGEILHSENEVTREFLERGIDVPLPGK
ncbi:MAG: ATP-binding cassette domain-containing protein [Candidatus Sumerlaeia bacterium]|nr:ATP-binding cassette domain-containing protein [Candidatus Sumerlaeia bacterium]